MLLSLIVVGVLSSSALQKSRFSLKSLGIQTKPGVEIFEGSNGRGLRTVEPIEANEAFLRIPLENTFYVIEENGEENEEEGMNWPFALAAKIATELEIVKGEEGESKWSSYFDSLPSEDDFKKDLSHHWDAADVAVFFRDMEDNDNFYDSALICEGIQNARSFRSEAKELTSGNKYSCYALDIIQTRCCGFRKSDKQNYHIVAPGFDLMNHSPEVHSNFHFEKTESGDECLACCHREQGIEVDAEVFLNYAGNGEMSQEACFVHYGFVVKKVGYYLYHLPRSMVSRELFANLEKSTPETITVLDVFNAMQLSLSAAFIVSESEISDFSSSLRMAVRILASSENEEQLETMIEHGREAACYIDEEHDACSLRLLKTLLQEICELIAASMTAENPQGKTETKGYAVRKRFLENNVKFLGETLETM